MGQSERVLTVDIDDWQHVEVILFDDGLDGAIGAVLGDELVGHVLDGLQEKRQSSHNRLSTSRFTRSRGREGLPPAYHGDDPFSGVDGAVENNSRLLTSTATAKDVQSRDGATGSRVSRSDDFDVAGIFGCDIPHPGQVVSIGVV